MLEMSTEERADEALEVLKEAKGLVCEAEALLNEYERLTGDTVYSLTGTLRLVASSGTPPASIEDLIQKMQSVANDKSSATFTEKMYAAERSLM